MSTIRQFDVQPLYSKISQDIAERIAKGEWKLGKRLPAEPEFARAYNVASATVRRALDDLKYQGIVTREQGSGTYVADLDEQMRAALPAFRATAELVLQTAIAEYDWQWAPPREAYNEIVAQIALALFNQSRKKRNGAG